MSTEEDDSGESDNSMEDPLIVGKENAGMTVGDVIEQARQQAAKGVNLDEKLTKMLICCGCLGDRSDDINEIVECDGCGVTVHEGKDEWKYFYFTCIFGKQAKLQEHFFLLKCDHNFFYSAIAIAKFN